jgi:hypothetical protein
VRLKPFRPDGLWIMGNDPNRAVRLDPDFHARAEPNQAPIVPVVIKQF